MHRGLLFVTRAVALAALAAGHIWVMPGWVGAVGLGWLAIGDFGFGVEHWPKRTKKRCHHDFHVVVAGKRQGVDLKNNAILPCWEKSSPQQTKGR